MTVDQKQKQYTTEAIALARRVQADVDELRGRVDELRAAGYDRPLIKGAMSSYAMTLKEHLDFLYGRLGDTSSAVADTLGAMGVVGVVMDSECCPLANLGRMATGIWVHVVDGEYSLQDSTVDDVWHDLPHAAATMMRAFDCGEYPWLERDPQGDEGAVQLAGEEHTHVI
jgi:hypothetical protein